MPQTDGRTGSFGGYLLDQEVGRGGVATVYRAHPPADPTHPVALKVLREGHRTPAELARLQREFELADSLDHRHIVTVYRCGPGWLAMQFIGGGNCTRLSALDDRLTALAQIADALDYAHRNGIVHCDVKPANILVGADFTDTGAILVDFGVAHAVVEDVGRRQHRPQVSLPYAAPEILLGQPPSAATDEYALACSAVELLTKTPPFTSGSAAELVHAHLHRRPPLIATDFDWASRAVDTVLSTAMAKAPELRYRSCTEFVTHLVRAVRR